MTSTHRVLIGILSAAVVALGVLYYRETRDDITVELPSVTIKE